MRQGDIIGDRFEIERHVATGGMGQVYRARDLETGETVALKTLLGDMASHVVARFDHERRALANLSHPGIVRYVAHGLAPAGVPFLVMEWLEGEDLATRLARGRLSIKESLEIAAQVAEALSAAHARGIVHRDLKPSNIFLADARTDRVKVLDFGIARLESGVTRVTLTGAIIGTLGYMAPEQASNSREHTVEPSIDVFSLGCVLFECLAGTPAFEADHPMAVLTKLVFAEPPRLADVLPAAPEALDALLARMLAKDPAARLPHGGAVVESIARLGSQVATTTPIETPSGLTLDEQQLLSVVLVQPDLARGELVRTDDLPTVSRGPALPADQALRQGAAAWGGRLEQLRDGSLVVAIGGVGLVTDQAAQAARCALWLRSRLPGRRMALATGRGDRSGRLPAAQTIDRAAALLLASSGSVNDGAPTRDGSLDADVPPTRDGSLDDDVPPTRDGSLGGDAAPARSAHQTNVVAVALGVHVPGGGDPAREGIAIDDVTARLLDARFDVRDAGRCHALYGEQELGDGARLLLGKPTPCMGRDLELRALSELFEECIEEPAPRAAIVTAPPGAGKSRLAQELLRSIKDRGAPVSIWVGRGEPHRAGSAFGLLSQILRSACGINDGEPPEAQREKLTARVAARLPPDERRRVAEFLGEIARAPFSDEASPPLLAARQDAQLMNDQMRAAFLDFLAAEAAIHPVVLVLEDVQWGDRPTVHFLDAALRELAERPLFVLALGRPEVHQVFPRLWAERAIQELPLKQLGKRASERLVRHVLGAEVGADTVERLVRLSEGNAFFLEELIRATAEGRREDLPVTVVAMVQSRLDALSDDARRLLRAASVFGEVFWAGAAARLLGSARRAAGLTQRLEELARRELIVKRKQSRFPEEEEYAFRHALLREGAYALLTDEDRVLGHRLAGEWLEQHGEEDPLALAEHFEQGREGERAGLHYLRAAEQASHGGDSTAVIARAQRALGYRMPEELRTRCLGMLCELYYYTMDLESGRPYADEVLRTAARGSGPWSQGMLVEIVGRIQAGDLGEFVRLVELAGETTPAPGAVRPWAVCVATGMYLFDLLGRTDAANRLLHELEANVRAAGEAEPIALALYHAIQALRLAYAEEDPRQGVVHSEALRAISERTGQRRYQELAKTFIGMNRWYLGAIEEAARTILGVTLAGGDVGLASSHRPFVLAWAHADLGALGEARLWAERLVESGRTRRVPLDEGRGRWALAEVLRRAGELAAADTEIERALALLRAASPLDAPGALATLAALRLTQGRPEEALAAAEDGVQRQAAMATCGFFRGAFLRLIHAECLAAAGAGAAAAAAIAAARDHVLALAERIGDAAERRSFLEDVPENRRTLELAAQWERAGAPATPGGD